MDTGGNAPVIGQRVTSIGRLPLSSGPDATQRGAVSIGCQSVVILNALRLGLLLWNIGPLAGRCVNSGLKVYRVQ